MTEEATDTLELIPFRFNIEFLQELDGIVLAASREDAEEDIRERGEQLPQFVLKNLTEVSKEEYTKLMQESGLGNKKETLN